MRQFVHQAAAARVVFAAGGLARVPAEVATLDRDRVLVIAGGSATRLGDRVAAELGPRAVGRLTRVAQHVPEWLAAEAVAAAGTAGANCLCSIGGGSATGLAKAVAVAVDLPIVAVPTTYAGSEATAAYGLTGERKRTASDPRARPRTVIYDPSLTIGLPARATAAGGFNALAHAVAALAGPAYDPLAQLYAMEAARIIARALPVAVRCPDDLDARGDLLWAAWLAASALAATGAGTHHRLCHVLGGRYRLVHAELHAVLLPHTVARDDTLSADGRAALARAIGARDAAAGLHDLARRVGIPDGLAAIGMPAQELDAAAREAADAVGPDHPHRGDGSWFRALLDDAYPHHTTHPHHPSPPHQGRQS